VDMQSEVDGYRALIMKHIRSRNDKNLTETSGSVRGAAERLKADSAGIDGEILALAFGLVGHSFSHSRTAKQNTITSSSSTPLIYST